MTREELKNSIISAVVIALLVGGSAPWWYKEASKLFVSEKNDCDLPWEQQEVPEKCYEK